MAEKKYVACGHTPPCWRIALFLLIGFSLLASPIFANGNGIAPNLLINPQAVSSPPTRFAAAGEAELVQLINQARSEQGLQPLTVDERLTRAARKHTALMAQHAALSHQFEGEPPPQTRISNEQLASDREGENVDLDESIPSAHEALMHSPLHRRSILDPDFNVVGVGVLRVGENIYVTEDFARKLPDLSEPQAEANVQAAIEKYARSRGLPVPARRSRAQLRHVACDMALNDALDSRAAAQLPGVHEVFAWTTGDPAKLPNGIDKMVSPQPSGYSLGACFAPSVSHPGGVYWIVMVTY
jgi:uncharacterized protein YkwD